LRLAGIASIGAALIAVAGDEILQYSPQGYSSLADVERALPFWRLLTGEMLGVLGIPLCLVGYWCVCQILRLSNVKGTRVMFWLAAETLVLGVASHAIVSSAFVAMHVGSTSALIGLANTLQNSAIIPGSLFLLGYLAISIWYFVAVIAGHTLYPRWMAFVNPFLLSLLILSVSNVLPIVWSSSRFLCRSYGTSKSKRTLGSSRGGFAALYSGHQAKTKELSKSGRETVDRDLKWRSAQPSPSMQLSVTILPYIGIYALALAIMVHVTTRSALGQSLRLSED
jgi:hypothetical protein